MKAHWVTFSTFGNKHSEFIIVLHNSSLSEMQICLCSLFALKALVLLELYLWFDDRLDNKTHKISRRFWKFGKHKVSMFSKHVLIFILMRTLCLCTENFENCRFGKLGSEYTGNMSRSRTGDECLYWKEVSSSLVNSNGCKSVHFRYFCSIPVSSVKFLEYSYYDSMVCAFPLPPSSRLAIQL